jgi:hypothetical protein
MTLWVRSTAALLHTIMLDALDSGRVEEVLVSDGILVANYCSPCGICSCV